MAQTVKNLPAMLETQVRSLGQEDALEKGMAAHSSILVWRIPWTEEPGRLQSMGSQRVTTERLTHTHTQEGKRTGVMPVLLGPSILVMLGPRCPFAVVLGAMGGGQGASSRAPTSQGGGQPGECHSR